MNETRYWLWLSLVFGAANPRVWDVLEHYESVQDAFYALREGEITGLTPSEERNARTAHLEQVDAVLEYCARNHISVTTYEDAAYPACLRNIYNPPLVLFSMGRLELMSDFLGITVVGTRRPSSYSIRIAEMFAKGLGENGLTVVSGFALGIDEVAHETALAADKPTIAVLGCGLNVNYPKEHAELKERMIRNGLLLTEFFPGTQPLGSNFPKRNRILSGLSLGTLVVEAAIGSGSLITADHAIEQGRDVFCVPPSDITDRRYAGVIRYLRDGAIPAFTLNDILFEYYTTYPHKLSSASTFAPAPGQPSESAAYTAPKPIAPMEEPAPVIRPKSEPQKKESVGYTADYATLTGIQRSIVDLLSRDGTQHADVLALALEMDIDALLYELTELELLGVVTPLFGKLYELTEQ